MNLLVSVSMQVIKYMLVAEAYYLARMYFMERLEAKGEDNVNMELSKGKERSSESKSSPGELKTLGEDENANLDEAKDVLALKNPYNKAIFFPDTTIVIPQVMGYHQRKQRGINSIQDDPNMWWNIPNFFEEQSKGPLKELIRILRKATRTIDVCMFVISFPTLADVLIELRQRWVDVRLIVDGREEEALKSQVNRLKNSGIKVRCNEHSFSVLMHNKFVVIDDNLALTGSFNWTKNAVLSNYDNVLITNQPTLVKHFSEEFTTLWSKFVPYQPHAY